MVAATTAADPADVVVSAAVVVVSAAVVVVLRRKRSRVLAPDLMVLIMKVWSCSPTPVALEMMRQSQSRQ